MAINTLILIEASAEVAGTTERFRDHILYQVLRGKVTRNNDIVSQVRVIVEWVKSSMIYVKDPVGQEQIASPLVLLDRIVEGGAAFGDCDDHVVLLLAALISVGIDCVPVGVKTRPTKAFTHVIASAYFDNRWVDIDPCAKGRPQMEFKERLIAK